MKILEYLKEILKTEDEIKEISDILIEEPYNDISLYEIKVLKYNKVVVKELDINSDKKDLLDDRTFYIGIDKNDNIHPYKLIFNPYNIMNRDFYETLDTILYFENYQILLFYIKFIISTIFIINNYYKKAEDIENELSKFVKNIDNIFYKSLDTYNIYHIDKLEALKYNILDYYKTLSIFKFKDYIKEDIKILSENNTINNINIDNVYTLIESDEAEQDVLFNINGLFFNNKIPYIMGYPDDYIDKHMLLQLKERGFDVDIKATLDSYRNRTILNLQKLISK